MMNQTDQKSQRFSLTTIRESLAFTPRSLALTWRFAPRATLLLGILTVVGAMLPLAVAWVGKTIIDAVVAANRDLALRQVLCELGLIATQALTIRALGLLRQLLGARLSVDINVMILEKAQTLELRHFEDPAFYDQLTKARREASFRPVSVITDTFTLIQNILTLGGYVALLVGYDWRAVLALFAAALPAALAEMHFSTAAFRLRNWRAPESRQLNYVEHVLANDSHAKEVKLFGLGPHLLARYRATGDALYEEDARLAVKRAGWAFGLSLLGTGTFYACYAFMAIAAALGRLTLGNLTLYVVAFRQGQQAFQSILTAIGGMYENNLYMSNLFSYLEISSSQAAPAAPDVPSALPTGAGPHAEQGLRFERVSFRYPEGALALDGIDLFIPKGKSIALVGHNGAGKTTLVKLLARLYEPTDGRILLDGVDLREWDVEALRRRIGVVFQDFNRYHLSFAENVGFGSIDHLGDAPRLARAVEQGGAGDVLAKLPEGASTTLGRWFRLGTELSGGQWQKVALARAFMREEADILVLDEPTAALDAAAEHAVFERFKALTAGRTTVLISHRFPTVRMADEIIVLGGGRVVERGSHAQLIAQGGRYADLFALQAKGYL